MFPDPDQCPFNGCVCWLCPRQAGESQPRGGRKRARERKRVEENARGGVSIKGNLRAQKSMLGGLEGWEMEIKEQNNMADD